MIVFRKCINVLIFCSCMSSALQGMQSQPQSTSSAISIPVMAQFSQTGESKEITVPQIQRQHALIGSLLANPSPLQSFMSSDNVAVPVNNVGTEQSVTTNQAVALPVINQSVSTTVLKQFYTGFVYGIQQKNDQIIAMFLGPYATGFELIKQLISNAEYEYLDQLFDVIDRYDLPFSIDEVPTDGELTLLEFACECYYKDQTEKRKSIINRLLLEGSSIVEFVKENNVPWVDFLLQCEAGEDFDEHGFSALHKACSSKEVITLLMDYDIEQYESGSAYEALVEAVEKNDIAAAKEAINRGVNVPNMFDSNGNHLLAVAAAHKNGELAELLLLSTHMKLDYLVATNDYGSLQFIFTEVQGYSISLAECKRLLGIVTRSTKNLSHVKALLDKQRQILEPRMTDDDEKEIANMTNNPFGQIEFTKVETDFIFEVSQYQYKKAQKILTQDSTVRLRLIEIAEKNLMTFILSDPFASQRAKDQKTFVAFLLKNHFNQLYPMIQDMVRNNQYALLKNLIACGLDVNARAQFPGSEELLYGKPETLRSLLGVAFQEAVTRNDNDITMIALLLQARDSLPELLKERDYDFTQDDLCLFAKLLKLFRQIPDDWLERVKSLNDYDLWTFGVLLYERMTNPNSKSAAVLMQKLPSILATQHNQNSVEHVAHISSSNNSASNKKSKKRHLNDDEKIEAQNADKRMKAENKQQEQLSQQAASSSLSLTPSLAETAAVHQTQSASSSRSFDPSRWLNAVSIDVAKS